ncbi:MAG TPA: DUF5662 family protein, partial [Parachlamydiaceae bacterium]|nr:DUF5662 family protein [Parachlamydiaceae bacterium]
TFEEQLHKVQEFKLLADGLSPQVATILTGLLVDETRLSVIDMLQNAVVEDLEFNAYLDDFQEVISRPQNRNVEFAREMLFFVAELKIHRQYIHEFGVALGCPEKQLLRHDLCKLIAEQFEGYARFFRGGRLQEDHAAYLAAWEKHQHEEHYLESYSKNEFNFDDMTDERLQYNMLEVVADHLAATKQRGGGSLVDRLVHVFPKTNPHPRLIPYLEKGFKKAHAFYLESEENPESDSIFKGLPCWSSEVEEVFSKLKANS